MAEIVMTYSASHAPMMTANRESAPREQAENFLGALPIHEWINGMGVVLHDRVGQ